MGVFHIFEIVQMVINRATYQIYTYLFSVLHYPVIIHLKFTGAATADVL